MSRCLIVTIVVLASVGCGGGDRRSDGSVVATTSIWADVVGQVACGPGVSVVALIPPGSDPHEFEPSLADRGLLGSAPVVFANGLGLEGGIGDTLDAVSADGTPIVAVAPLVASGGDPHVWQDPTLVSAALPAIASALVDYADLDAATVDECVESYQAELEALDAEIAEAVESLADDRRALVTNHDALGYFASRYGLEVVGTVIPSPSTLAETNPADLEELASVIAERGVSTIFAEAQHSDDDVRALAAEVGDVAVATLYSDSLGEPGTGAETYVGMMRHDAMLIIDGLGDS